MFIVSYECKMSLIQQLDDCYHQRGILGQVGGAVGQIGGRRFGPRLGADHLRAELVGQDCCARCLCVVGQLWDWGFGGVDQLRLLLAWRR